MEGKSRRATFRITDQLDPAELADWDEAEKAHKETAVRASRRRDHNEDPFTEEQLKEAESLLDQLRRAKTRPDLFQGNRSGSAPPIFVDGDPSGTEYGSEDQRGYDEYSAQMEGACPRTDEIPMISAAQLAACGSDPYARLCHTYMTKTVFDALGAVNVRLKSLMLSETEHRSVAAFMEAAGVVSHIATAGNLFLFGVYANYGVACLLGPNWTLEHYAFTSSNACVRS